MTAPRRRRTRRGEDGVALVAAVSVTAVLLLTGSAVALSVVSGATATTGHILGDAAAEAAQAGVNEGFAVVESALSAGAALPCSVSGQPGVQPHGSAAESYADTLSYYGTLTGATPSDPIACSGGTVPASGVAAVAVVADGTAADTAAAPAERMYALASISSVFDSGYSIYDGSQVEFTNSMTTDSTMGTVYVAGPVQCNSSARIDGDLYANGAVNLTNSCTVTGTLDAAGNVTVSSYPTVDGAVTADGSVTFGNAGPPAQFASTLAASGTVADQAGKPVSTNVSGAVVAGQPVTLPTPPAFPEIPWDQAAWQSAGWTVETYTNTSDCGSYYGVLPDGSVPPADASGVYSLLFGTSTLLSPTVIYTDCPLNLWGNVAIADPHGLAVVDTAAVQMSNTVTFQSASAAVQDLYLMVPWQPAITCSSSNEIQANSEVRFGTAAGPLYTLVYTPCEFQTSNTVAVTGQIAAGSLGSALDNNVTFDYVPFQPPPGTANEAAALVPVAEYVQSAP